MARPSEERSEPKRARHDTLDPRSSKTPHIPPARTQRKIQWLDENEGGVGLPQGSTHLSDEHRLDLTEALEKYRESKEKTWSKIHYYTPRTPMSPSDESTSPVISSDETSDAKDYFEGSRAGIALHYRSDTDYSYPPSTTSSRTHLQPGTSSGRPQEGSETQSPIHDVPGNYINPFEEAGLPGTRDLKKYSKYKAMSVVQTHLNGTKRGVKARMRGTKRKGDYFLPHESPLPSGQRKDVEDGPPELDGPHSRRGILSSLLQPHGNGGESFRSLSTLPQGLRRLTNLRNQASKEGKGKKRHWQVNSKLSFTSFSPRPVQSRNAGGVIGSLIASTGNLAGAAAPIHNQLQSSVKRPGYRLSRYSLKSPVPPPPHVRLSGNCSQFESGSTTPLSPWFRTFSTTMFDNLPYVGGDRRRCGASTPAQSQPASDYGDWVLRRHHEPEGRNHKRRKAEVFITRHVARVIQREEFILKLTRAMMMFGGPSHRLQSQIQSAARILNIDLCVEYLPDSVLISFDDGSTGTSHVRIIKQASVLDLGKLTDAYQLYWKVIHDEMFVADASAQLDILMRKKPFYNWWQQILIGGMCSASICTVSFGGSFIDALVVYPLGALLVGIQQLSVRHVLYANIFEFTITALFSFVAAALAATHHVCYPAIASSSVVLILPGFLVLTGSLEIMSRKTVAGSTRICFAIMYALFLGFGSAIGAACFEHLTHTKVYGAEDYSCALTHNPNGPWYQTTPSKFWAFLTVPHFSLFLSMRNQAPYNRKELPLLVIIASIGWVTNYFTGTRFVGQSDITAAVGAFAVGIIANIYARVFSGSNAFVVMITGILFQLPSGLGNDGLLSYASQQASGSTTSYISGFHTAMRLVSVAIGLTVGLGMASVLAHPRQSRRREDGIFSL
ncbi:DUF1212-domain-containing protein [Macrolepiota fuliginosa MF-IS2]|uniref:DUF1212-domain-containing protein n=1 Tax=Macrolepiota fuliginosa MF-IS2 TaxID=1400762 RepID=A0A9P5XCX6_9AGAR|nr:DUF1212-domain-containing protein [Macrolepiota fuliginosa MF-IS2]